MLTKGASALAATRAEAVAEALAYCLDLTAAVSSNAPGRSLATCDAAGAADRPARRRDRLAAPIRCRECDLERVLHIRFGTRGRQSGSTGREAARQDAPPRIALDARGTTDSTDRTPRAMINAAPLPLNSVVRG